MQLRISRRLPRSDMNLFELSQSPFGGHLHCATLPTSMTLINFLHQEMDAAVTMTNWEEDIVRRLLVNVEGDKKFSFATPVGLF